MKWDLENNQVREKENNELARRMGRSKVQLGRLLNQSFYGKSTDQMIKLLNALDCDFLLKVVKAA